MTPGNGIGTPARAAAAFAQARLLVIGIIGIDMLLSITELLSLHSRTQERHEEIVEGPPPHINKVPLRYPWFMNSFESRATYAL